MTLRLDPTPIEGLILVRPEPHVDERGAFARLYCADAFAAAGIDFRPVQISASFNPHVHTLRGMHWQAAPHGEAKLVRVTRGRAFDVAIDLRDGSATRGTWFGRELTADNRCALLIPRGFAHGFLTLEPDTELTYVMDADHVAEAARGARFDDPAFGIAWPAVPALIGARDRAWPAWAP